MKKEQRNMSDELLVKCLLGEASLSEAQQVDAWLHENEANRKYFDQFRLIWDASKKLELKSTADPDAAWERFKQKATAIQPEKKVIQLRSRINWLRAAAILLLLVGIGWSALYFSGQLGTQMAYVHAGDEVINYTLSDGTTITLNKGATLHYPEKFRGKNREVELEGEAFFNVAPNKAKPFIINVNNVNVEVVGTSFNIKETSQDVEVIVETGVVEVAKKKNSVTLRPNEKVIVQNNSDELVKQQVTDELYNYYRTREFICNGTPLWRLVDVLNEAYNAKIKIADPGIADLPLTTTFRNETLDNILSVVAETLEITVEKQGSEIILKKN